MFSKALPSLRSATSSQLARPAATASSSVARRIAIAGRPYSSASGSSDKASSSSNGNADANKNADASSKASSSGDAAAAEEKVKALEAQIKDLKDKDLYNRAEIQTLSRRIGEERSKASEFAISKFALSLLGTSDVLTTALSHVPKPLEPGSPLASLANGVELTQKQLWKTFEQHGVKKMVVDKGAEFDPNSHEATFSIPSSVAGPRGDGKEWGNGQVVEVSKEGWTIGSRVLRPAQVGITQLE